MSRAASRQHASLYQLEREKDIVELWHQWNGIATEIVAMLRGQTTNAILWSGSITIPAAGVYTFDHFTVPYAFVHVVNLGADTMTLANRPVADAAPNPALGVKKIPGGAGLGFNLAGIALSLYGNAGDVANVEVHVKPDRAGP